ncbi:MAG: hypothetical protein ACTSVY_14245 [Candidatus Helarchaeota archaeon]
MKKQKSLFDSFESKEKKKKKKKKNINIQDKIIQKNDTNEVLEREDTKIKQKFKKVPKNEFYICECGLKIHWKVAEARKMCPQCNARIKIEDIFDTVSVVST